MYAGSIQNWVVFTPNEFIPLFELNAFTNEPTNRWQVVQHHVMAEFNRAFLFDYDVISDTMIFCSRQLDGRFEEETLHGYVSQKCGEIIYEEDRERHSSALFCALEFPMSAVMEFRAKYFSKNYHWCRSNYVSLADATGRVYRVIGRIDDIESERQIRRQESGDILTGLLSQAATKAAIKAALDEAQQGAFFVVDIDDFKMVNDRRGHLFGDSLLREASKKMARLFREEDIIGRIGGDEFVVFIPRNLKRGLLEKKAQAILDVFSMIDIPRIGSAHASIGISFVEQGEHQDYSRLLKKADRALNKAKLKGKNRYMFFGEESGSEPRTSFDHTYDGDNAESTRSEVWPTNVVK